MEVDGFFPSEVALKDKLPSTDRNGSPSFPHCELKAGEKQKGPQHPEGELKKKLSSKTPI